jgi:tetratricopeptide (TPR) repeat protein
MYKIFLFLILSLGTNLLYAQNSKYDQAAKYAGEGKLNESLALLDELTVKEPRNVDNHILKIRIHIAMEEFDKALKSVDMAIRAMPDSAIFYDAKANILESQGQFELAIASYKIAFQKADSDGLKAHVLSNMGGVKAKIQQYKSAYDDLILATKLDSTNLDVLNNLATVCDEVGRLDETIFYLKKILAADPEYVGAYINLGFKYQGLEQHEEAVKYLSTAIKLAPEEPFGYSNRAFSLLKLKDLEAAMRDINQSIRLDPSNSYAFKIRALIFLEKNESALACADLKIAHNLGYAKRYGDEVKTLMEQNCGEKKQ